MRLVLLVAVLLSSAVMVGLSTGWFDDFDDGDEDSDGDGTTTAPFTSRLPEVDGCVRAEPSGEPDAEQVHARSVVDHQLSFDTNELEEDTEGDEPPVKQKLIYDHWAFAVDAAACEPPVVVDQPSANAGFQSPNALGPLRASAARAPSHAGTGARAQTCADYSHDDFGSGTDSHNTAKSLALDLGIAQSSTGDGCLGFRVSSNAWDYADWLKLGVHAGVAVFVLTSPSGYNYDIELVTSSGSQIDISSRGVGYTDTVSSAGVSYNWVYARIWYPTQGHSGQWDLTVTYTNTSGGGSGGGGGSSSCGSQNDVGSGTDAPGSRSQAIAAPTLTTTWGCLDSSDTVDWYRFTLPSSHYAEVELWSPQNSDYDILLTTNSGSYVDAGQLISYDVVSTNGSASSSFRIKIYRVSGSGTYYFGIWINSTGSGGSGGSGGSSGGSNYCSQDNDGNSGQDAGGNGIGSPLYMGIDPDTGSSAFYPGCVDSVNDIDDVYRFGTSPGMVTDITVDRLDPSDTSGDLDLYLFNNLGVLVSSGVGSSNSETVSTAGAGATFYIMIHANSGSALDYRLTVSSYTNPSGSGGASAQCQYGDGGNSVADAPDNVSSLAARTDGNWLLPDDPYGILQGCVGSGDLADAFGAFVSGTMSIDVALEVPSGSDYDLKIYDSALSLVDWSSNAGNSTERVSAYSSSGESFYFLVSLFSGGGDNYTLRLFTNSSGSSGGGGGNSPATLDSPTLHGSTTYQCVAGGDVTAQFWVEDDDEEGDIRWLADGLSGEIAPGVIQNLTFPCPIFSTTVQVVVTDSTGLTDEMVITFTAVNFVSLGFSPDIVAAYRDRTSWSWSGSFPAGCQLRFHENAAQSFDGDTEWFDVWDSTAPVTWADPSNLDSVAITVFDVGSSAVVIDVFLDCPFSSDILLDSQAIWVAESVSESDGASWITPDSQGFQSFLVYEFNSLNPSYNQWVVTHDWDTQALTFVQTSLMGEDGEVVWSPTPVLFDSPDEATVQVVNTARWGRIDPGLMLGSSLYDVAASLQSTAAYTANVRYTNQEFPVWEALRRSHFHAFGAGTGMADLWTLQDLVLLDNQGRSMTEFVATIESYGLRATPWFGEVDRNFHSAVLVLQHYSEPGFQEARIGSWYYNAAACTRWSGWWTSGACLEFSGDENLNALDDLLYIVMSYHFHELTRSALRVLFWSVLTVVDFLLGGPLIPVVGLVKAIPHLAMAAGVFIARFSDNILRAARASVHELPAAQQWGKARHIWAQRSTLNAMPLNEAAHADLSFAVSMTHERILAMAKASLPRRYSKAALNSEVDRIYSTLCLDRPTNCVDTGGSSAPLYRDTNVWNGGAAGSMGLPGIGSDFQGVTGEIVYASKSATLSSKYGGIMIQHPNYPTAAKSWDAVHFGQTAIAYQKLVPKGVPFGASSKVLVEVKSGTIPASTASKLMVALDDPANHIVGLACTATGYTGSSRAAKLQACVDFVTDLGSQVGVAKSQRLMLFDASGYELKMLAFDANGKLASKWIRLHADSAGTVRMLHPHSGVTGRSAAEPGVYLFLMDGDQNHLAILDNGSTLHPHPTMHAIVTNQGDEDSIELWIPSPLVSVEIHYVSRLWYVDWAGNGSNEDLVVSEPLWRGNSSGADWLSATIDSAAEAYAVLNAVSKNLWDGNKSGHCWLETGYGLCISSDANNPWTVVNGEEDEEQAQDNETVNNTTIDESPGSELNETVADEPPDADASNDTVEENTTSEPSDLNESTALQNNSTASADELDEGSIDAVPGEDITITIPLWLAQVLAVSTFWIIAFWLNRRFRPKNPIVLPPPAPPPIFYRPKPVMESLPPPPEAHAVDQENLETIDG